MKPFELFTAAGYSGSQSVRLRNYGSEEGNVDELVGPTIDLSQRHHRRQLPLRLRPPQLRQRLTSCAFM